MKKVLLAATTILMAATVSVFAQDYEKNIYGVRVGVNVTSANVKVLDAMTLDTKAHAGFFVGGVYQRLLTGKLPLYLETGLNFSQWGFDLVAEEAKYNVWYLQVPVMLNYKFFVNNFTLYPSVGLVYSLGLAGTQKYSYGGISEKYKVFGKYDNETGNGGILNRSDFGMRIALNAEWKNFYIGAAYGLGFLNLVQTDYDDAIKIHNNCTFTISVGYNF